MARGKYKNAAEARRVREDAIAEAEAGRRAIVKLTAENKELREMLATEREVSTMKFRELNSLIAEGTSGEVAALRERLNEAEDRVRNANKVAALRIRDFLRYRANVTGDPNFWGDLASHMGLTGAELFAFEGGTRAQRRTSAKDVRRRLNFQNEVRGKGIEPSGIEGRP